MFERLHKILYPHWLQLQQQTAANPRLRWMLWGVLYIFLLYVALSLGEWRAEQQQAISQLQRTAQKLEQLESQTEWPERLVAEQQTGKQLSERLWKAPSAGLAEADLQNYLREQIINYSGEGFRLRLAPTETLILGEQTLFKVTAEISALIQTTQIDALTKSLSEGKRTLVVERFSYSPQRSGQFGLLVTAYFLAVEEVAGAVDATP
uniref:hypothetical protein n=1 Tax=Cellvibrio fontiphilus TaxID=1815559 RepID=UPI002B4C245E|nr:hypothetical protein [Cellvibrio fontiphilus]